MLIECKIPQLGEGLLEVLLVSLLKQPGDRVERDEPLYEMETDKAITEVESPVTGRLVEWLVEEGAVLPIGAPIAKLEAESAAESAGSAHHIDVRANSLSEAESERFGTRADMVPKPVLVQRSLRNADVPPRTRRYLQQKGLLESAHQIPARSGKLTPADVDAWLDEQQLVSTATNIRGEEPFVKFDLSRLQQQLNYRLQRAVQRCVPASLAAEVDWSAIDRASAALKTTDNAPTAFTLVLWCVVQAVKNHSRLRSTLAASGKRLLIYENVNLGIAVALEDDRLVTAVVQRADQLAWPQFADAVRERIETARQGVDQATAATTLSVSNIGSLGIRSGIPVVVPPSVGTLTVGQTFWNPVPDPESGFRFRKTAIITLAFDHRVMNGLAVGKFINELQQRIEQFEFPPQSGERRV